MTTVTVYTSAGSRIRSASQRRFIVVAETIHRATQNLIADSAHIEKRSDNLETLLNHCRRENRKISSGQEDYTRRTIIDTLTGQEIK